MCSGLPTDNSQGWGKLGICKSDTLKPLKPALGFAPRPAAPSSRISPPAPVAAPAKGEIAVGWLWVSTLIMVVVILHIRPPALRIGTLQNGSIIGISR
jgi:hypothetical protein